MKAWKLEKLDLNKIEMLIHNNLKLKQFVWGPINKFSVS